MQDSPVLSWKVAGLLLGLLVILATALVKPFGVSTQYVVTDAVVLHSAAPTLAESNEYLNKYGTKEDWGVGYGWMLVPPLPSTQESFTSGHVGSAVW